MPYSPHTLAQEDALDRAARREAIWERRREVEQSFGPSTGNEQDDDRQKWRVIIAAAREAKEAEDKFLPIIAQWLGEQGDTWPEPHPGEAVWKTRERFHRILSLAGADVDGFFTIERILKLVELVEGGSTK